MAKCTICKARHRASPYDGTYVLYDGKCFCIQCLIEKRTAKGTRKDKWSADEAEQKIEALKEQMYENDKNKEGIEKVIEFVEEHYSPSFLPKSFFEKLNDVYNGTADGQLKPIPPDDLLDMWQLSIEAFKKRWVKRINRGNDFSVTQMVAYDLSVLTSKYDSYLKYKSKVLEEQSIAEQNAVQRRIVVQQKREQNKSTMRDLTGIIDELFD